jgi:hypothetical protein
MIAPEYTLTPNGSKKAWTLQKTPQNDEYVFCHTDKKENLIFLIYREIQSGAVAKLYMTNGLLISGEIFSHFLIY